MNGPALKCHLNSGLKFLVFRWLFFKTGYLNTGPEFEIWRQQYFGICVSGIQGWDSLSATITVFSLRSGEGPIKGKNSRFLSLENFIPDHYCSYFVSMNCFFFNSRSWQDTQWFSTTVTFWIPDFHCQMVQFWNGGLKIRQKMSSLLFLYVQNLNGPQSDHLKTGQKKYLKSCLFRFRVLGIQMVTVLLWGSQVLSEHLWHLWSAPKNQFHQ